MGRGMFEGMAGRIQAQVHDGIGSGFARSSVFANHDFGGGAQRSSFNSNPVNLPSVFIESRNGNDNFPAARQAIAANGNGHGIFDTIERAGGKAENHIANLVRNQINNRQKNSFKNNDFYKNHLRNALNGREDLEREILEEIQKRFDEARRKIDFYAPHASDILKANRKIANRMQHADRVHGGTAGMSASYPGSDIGFSGGNSGGGPGGYSGGSDGYSGGNSSGSGSSDSGSYSPSRTGSYRPSGSDSTPITSAPNGEALHDGDFFISQAKDVGMDLGPGDLNIQFACGPTSLLMAIADWQGFTPTEEQRIALIKETKTDVNQQFVGDANKMGQFAAAHGLEYDPGQGWQELMADLNAGRSAIVNGNWPGFNSGHFIYVAGKTDDGRFIVGDPALQSAQAWSEQQLKGFMDRQGGWATAYVSVWDAEAKARGSSKVDRAADINNLNIAGAPTISADTIDEVLAAHNSPIAGEGQNIFDICVEKGIDPALALGFFGKESTFGTDGAATQTNSWGNIKNGQGGWRTYDNFLDGLSDWCDLMNDEYVKPQSEGGRGLPTLDTAIPVYAPSYDNNDVGKYINDVASWIADWREMERAKPAPSVQASSGSQTASVSASGSMVGPDGQSRDYAFPVPDYAEDQVNLHWLAEGAIGASDIMAPVGTPVVAFGSGKVVNAYFDKTGGNSVLIQQDDGLTAYYAHMVDTPLVRAGETVTAGQPLGAVGNTGNAANTDPHLHFGLGYGIKQGIGPDGGAGDADGNIGGGSHFNAIDALNIVLAENRATV